MPNCKIRKYSQKSAKSEKKNVTVGEGGAFRGGGVREVFRGYHAVDKLASPGDTIGIFELLSQRSVDW